MRAAVIVDHHIEVAERPDPVPGPGEVLVAVRAAGLNAADLAQVAGHYPPPPGVPVDMPGLELAGEVRALGPGAARFAVGDRVMAVVAGAAQAELAVVHERLLMPVPGSVGWDEAGGLPEAFTTAHDAVMTQAGLLAGERLLVHGAAGGVGAAAVGIGALVGAQVTATVRDPARRAAVGALGAETVIAQEGFGEHGPFDVVLELVGAPNLPDDVRALAPGGRIVVIGTGGGSKAELDLTALMVRRGRILASTLRARPLELKALAARAVERSVLPAFASGRLRVPVHAVHALGDAPDAYAAFAAGGHVGKVVLRTDRH